MDDVLRDRPLTSTSQALQGAVPGLQITYGSGQPGSGTSINIRGIPPCLVIPRRLLS
ncbi:TonB-dependent receptor plug domain-containing protein [Niabella sp. W65]|nr:TonB-dependent receptor plug domain-containing protein [Niabella sp. W65]MCH7363376.1 TonB-dependent receptor plug domain-containing protein [Niabella sp. W65]ULT39298.1 TonB-dependent receptor plug domain-containing protein [Niabella sp. I65]